MKKEKIKKHKLLLRHLTAEDYPQLAEMMDRVYDNLGGAWQKDQYISQVTRFPEGQIGIEDNGMLVAA
ncbi:MAG: hydrolase, partial [Methylomonas lenta]|nr:hydrolase [Methylomonas lenta]